MPGAIARLTDTPALHLLCIVGDVAAQFQTAAEAVPLPDNAEAVLEEILPEQGGCPCATSAKSLCRTAQAENLCLRPRCTACPLYLESRPRRHIQRNFADLAAVVGPNSTDIVGRRFRMWPCLRFCYRWQHRSTSAGNETPGRAKRLLCRWKHTPACAGGTRSPCPFIRATANFSVSAASASVRPAEAEATRKKSAWRLPAVFRKTASPGRACRNRPHGGRGRCSAPEEVANDDQPAAVLPKPPLDVHRRPAVAIPTKSSSLLNSCAQEKWRPIRQSS